MPEDTPSAPLEVGAGVALFLEAEEVGVKAKEVAAATTPAEVVVRGVCKSAAKRRSSASIPIADDSCRVATGLNSSLSKGETGT
jgi:hypothetical protein